MARRQQWPGRQSELRCLAVVHSSLDARNRQTDLCELREAIYARAVKDRPSCRLWCCCAVLETGSTRRRRRTLQACSRTRIRGMTLKPFSIIGKTSSAQSPTIREARESVTPSGEKLWRFQITPSAKRTKARLEGHIFYFDVDDTKQHKLLITLKSQVVQLGGVRDLGPSILWSLNHFRPSLPSFPGKSRTS